MIRLLIVDDDALVRAGLTMILQSAQDLQVVGEAADGAEVLEAVAAHQPDVVLMDIRMPKLDGLQATSLLQRTQNPPSVIVLTTFDLDDFVFQALRAGAAGFLLKDTPPLELIAAIRIVAAGEAMLSPTITRKLIDHFSSDPRVDRQRQAQQRIRGLTPREQETLVAVGRGLSNAEIGRQLFLSEGTVKTHVSRLLLKLDAANRVQVAILAHEAGLVDGLE